ncbi:MAG: UbiA family prenyltransferase [Thermoguttaceae bacterium]|nr:UbiA family prenyltransferase [Thermoguttaceae bacterium]
MSAFFRLVRFPAVFTVLADCAMGFLFTCRNPGEKEWIAFALICVASVCLYWFGMAFNDIVDADRDSLHPVRCMRPIPSGQISAVGAWRIAVILLLVGTVSGSVLACLFSSKLTIAALAGLISSIILYDYAFKPLWFAPLIMGLCRAFNILFAMSVFYNPETVNASAIALVLSAYCVYIVGVTWFSRYENADEENGWLPDEDESESGERTAPQAPWTPAAWLSSLVIGLGVLALIPLADLIPAENQYPIFAQDPIRWRMLIGVLGLMVGFRALQTLLLNNPRAIGPIVGYCLMTLIVLDATVVCLIHNPTAAICIVALLIPAIALNRITYIT